MVFVAADCLVVLDFWKEIGKLLLVVAGVAIVCGGGKCFQGGKCYGGGKCLPQLANWKKVSEIRLNPPYP